MNKSLKLGALAASAVAVAVMSVPTFAYGPSRTTFSMEKPATYVTFNSIIDNKKEVGDERNFFSTSLYTGNYADNSWKDEITVEDGKEYILRMYVHNNAYSGSGLVAEDTTAYVILPTDTASELTVSGKIYSSNANPQKVWDSAIFKSANGEKFNLAYVDGTAEYYNTDKDGKLRKFNLSKDLLSSTGALLGYDQMDGKIPGCIEYSGYVTLRVKAQFEQTADLDITQEVRVKGSDTWSESTKANCGDTVEYRIHYKNTGTALQKDVLIRETLPKGQTLVPGTTQVYNQGNDGVIVSDNITSETGINIGNYAAGGGAWIYFEATVNKDVCECGDADVIQRATVEANGGYGTKSDQTDVNIDITACEKPVDPTPKKMPTTGPSDIVTGVVAAAALTTATSLFVASRKKLNR